MLKKQASKKEDPSESTSNTERITINWLIEDEPSFSFNNLPTYKTLTHHHVLKKDQCFISDIFHPPVEA